MSTTVTKFGKPTTDGRRCITARWDGLDSYRSYALPDYPDGIESQDGDEWHDGCGDYISGDGWDGIAIRLIGGPRHREIVA